MASFSTSKITLRKDNDIFLVGSIASQIISSKLPSKREVLKVFFFNMREVKLNVQESARLAVQETILFWEKARIPTQAEKNCIPKLKKLYEKWDSVRKNVRRESLTQKEKEQTFNDELDDLFDIAHADALKIIKIEDDRQFLIMQRKKGRPGLMYGIDKRLAEKEQKAQEREQSREKRKRKSNKEYEELSERVELDSSSENEEDVSLPSTSGIQAEVCLMEVEEDVVEKQQRGRKTVITERVVCALDRSKVSDRDAVHIIIAVAEALGHDVKDLTINRSSIQRCRQIIRRKKAKIIKEEFQNVELNAAVIHWDGKLLDALTGKETVDRLPIILTNGDIEQLLHVPALENSTGKAQADAVFNFLCDWGLENIVKACCFDTTASNTGRKKGAVILLEKLLERKLLWLPCRHHMLEIILRAVFEIKILGTSGPDVPLFVKFQKSWPQIDKTKFLPGVAEEEVAEFFSDDDKTAIIEFLKNLENQTRDDYRELAQLCMIFLGEVTVNNFYKPGAVTHARWMAKAIYSLKIYLFRRAFKMNAATEKALRDICIFVVKIYVRNWFSAPFSTKAPQSDFNLIKNLYTYYDKIISDEALRKWLQHLWYLSPEAVGFAFFDDDISCELKEKMRGKINSFQDENFSDEEDEAESEYIPADKVNMKPSELKDIIANGLEQFVTRGTKLFFRRFGIDTSFLSHEAVQWGMNEDYKKAREIVRKIRVTNDTAERGVRLMKEYNSKLSTSEEQKQFILQVVSDYRKKFPDAKKKTLIE